MSARPWWLVTDVVAILVFVAIGRAVHDHGVSLRGMASTSWPFLLGLAVGWWPLLARRWNAASLGGGLVVLTSTVVIGMLLRAVSGQGTEVAFVIVATLFLGLFTLGPRWMVIRRRSRVGERPAAEG